MNLDDSEKLSLLFFVVFVLFFSFVVWTSPGVDPVVTKRINEIENNCTNCIIVDVKFSGAGSGYKAGGGSSWAKAINDKNEIVDVHLKDYFSKEALKLKGKRCSLRIIGYGWDKDGNKHHILGIKEVLE